MANQLDFQLPNAGFGSYLYGIIPDDQAVLAGAFATAMQQINNLNNVDIEAFAQVVYSLETNNGLPLTNGTNVPTDQFLVSTALSKVALGSDIYGAYNMSDFIGSMSGLPHPFQQIEEKIQQLQTPALIEIYKKLFLAVAWEPATATVNYSGTGPYTVSVTITNPGGGYGRDTSFPPNVTISGTSGLTITAEIGRDINDVTTLGKVTTITVTGTTPTVGSSTATIDIPPDDGTGGWPGMDAVVFNLITDANNEITNIQTGNGDNFALAKELNTLWNITGTALKIEQRSRYAAAPPVPIPYYPWLARYPQMMYNFVDTIPDLAADTEPNGAAQNLEAISDLCSPGGQSLIGLMRQERNQQRLNAIGIELDNNIPDTVDEQQQKIMLANGTIPGAEEGIEGNCGIYTLPAFAVNNECDGLEVVPIPVGYFDPNDLQFKYTDCTLPGSISAILENDGCGPYGDGTGPAIVGTDETIPVTLTGTLVPCGFPGGDGTGGGLPAGLPNSGTIINDVIEPETPTTGVLGFVGELFPPPEVLPPNLQLQYTAGILLPARYNVKDAIDSVIACNCDCWVE